MTFTEFKEKCHKGCKVIHVCTETKGTVCSISKDGDKALVLFEGGDKEWVEFYRISLDTDKR